MNSINVLGRKKSMCQVPEGSTTRPKKGSGWLKKGLGREIIRSHITWGLIGVVKDLELLRVAVGKILNIFKLGREIISYYTKSMPCLLYGKCIGEAAA